MVFYPCRIPTAHPQHPTAWRAVSEEAAKSVVDRFMTKASNRGGQAVSTVLAKGTRCRFCLSVSVSVPFRDRRTLTHARTHTRTHAHTTHATYATHTHAHTHQRWRVTVRGDHRPMGRPVITPSSLPTAPTRTAGATPTVIPFTICLSIMVLPTRMSIASQHLRPLPPPPPPPLCP